jgi:hypothetical protein
MPKKTSSTTKKKLVIRPKKPTKDPLITKKKTIKPIRKSTKRSKSKESDYEKCRKIIINRYMKLFERGILKIRGNKVTSQKQAIAIALQIAAKSCDSKMNRDDIQDMESKLQRAISARQESAGSKPLRYSDINRIVKLYTIYHKKGSKSKASRLRSFARKYLGSSPSIPISHRNALKKVIDA